MFAGADAPVDAAQNRRVSTRDAQAGDFEDGFHADESARAELRRSTAGVNVVAMFPRIIFVTLFLLGAAPRGLAWGREGHEAIGGLATALLHEKARLRVKKILGTDDLSDAAVWLDELKSAEKGMGKLGKDSEAIAFNKKFPDNHKWHFVNLPLNSAAYSRASKFAEDNDIVHILEVAVGVLEGRSKKFTPAQALRIIAHLVGDLHQPLHVGTGYFDIKNPAAPKLMIEPGSIVDKPDDLGGNKVLTGHGPFDNLHSMWDVALVEAAGATGNSEKLAVKLRSIVSPAKWASAGDYHVWPELWATDSVHEAEFAYRGLAFKGAKLSDNKKALVAIEAEPSADYEKIQKQRALVQLAKAGFHLAELLNALDWKTP